jgi:hypothetical protein
MDPAKDIVEVCKCLCICFLICVLSASYYDPVEDVVEFEDWMADTAHPDGVTIVLKDSNWDSEAGKLILRYPEVLRSFVLSA